MSDCWLGFSLAPNVGDGFEQSRGNKEDERRPGIFPDQIPVMPLRSDGSLCAIGPFGNSSSSSSQDWRCGSTAMVDANAADGGPKLENFLGSCYSSKDSAIEERRACNEVYQTDQACNSFGHNGEPFLNYNDSGRRVDQITSSDSYHFPFDGASSLSGFKSWLRQHPCSSGAGEKNESGVGMSSREFQSSLALSMSNVVPEGFHSGSQQDHKKRAGGASVTKEPVPRKTIDTFGQRTSQFRGVTRHRWTGRYEAHLWDNSCRKEGQSRKGRQVYLGGYDNEEKAAKAYDLAALKYWGPTTHTNYPVVNYEKEMDEMKRMSRQECVAHLRRKSSGFSRGASMYRGVTRHHQHGKWQARIGRVAGNKDLYLGTFSTQEEAAEAYDIAAIKFRGTSAVTNFDISRYDVKRICSSSTIIGNDLARRSPSKEESSPNSPEDPYNSTNNEITSSASTAAPKLVMPITTVSHQPNESTELNWSNSMQNSHPRNSNIGFVGYYNQTAPLSSSTTGFSSKDISKDQLGPKSPSRKQQGNNTMSSLHQVPMFALWKD